LWFISAPFWFFYYVTVVFWVFNNFYSKDADPDQRATTGFLYLGLQFEKCIAIYG